MTTCHHIGWASSTWPYIGARFTDGQRVVCGLCLPRDDAGYVLAGWAQVEPQAACVRSSVERGDPLAIMRGERPW